MGSMRTEVFWEENVAVDIQKIKTIQRITGSQYLIDFLLRVIVAFDLFPGITLVLPWVVCAMRNPLAIRMKLTKGTRNVNERPRAVIQTVDHRHETKGAENAQKIRR